MINQLIQDPPPAPTRKWDGVPAPEIDAFGQLPVQAGTFDHVDGLFYFTYAVCIFFFVLITGVLLYSVVAHRRKTWDQKPISTVTHNTVLEVVWTVIPLIIVMIMFAWGFKGSLDMTTVPHEAQRNTYKATASQWKWDFTYPDGSVSNNEVYVEVNKPVQFILESKDVLHAFYVPSMRVKRDVVPGRYQSVWFEPIKTGVYHLFCAEYCGDDHSNMYAKVHVVDAETMAKKEWDKVPADDAPLAERIKFGKRLAYGNCASCHVTGPDVNVNTGPSWIGLFKKEGDKYVGRQREVIEDGQTKTITTDAAYIMESIRHPMKKIVADPQYKNGIMNAFDEKVLNDQKVARIIDYMKSLADN